MVERGADFPTFYLMQLIDGGMFAFAAYHALKKKVKYPLTFQVPRMLRKLVDDVQDTFIVFWN